jgi:hypothetical protein
MINSRENIKSINISSLIMLMILALGLLTFHEDINKSSVSQRIPVSVFISLDNCMAIPDPGIRLEVFQKIWIINKDHFNLLAFNRNPLSDNKKTNLKIITLQDVRKESNRIPVYIFHHYPFSADKDEPPVLS